MTAHLHNDPVSALRSDITALRSAVKLLDGLADDYGGRVRLFLHEAALMAARGMALLSEHLPEERSAK